MLMVLPNQAGSLQGSRCVSSDILTANDPGTGSGWQQSKQNWALPAVVGYWARMQCSDPCCVQGARLHPYFKRTPSLSGCSAEWSKALAPSSNPQGSGFATHSCGICLQLARAHLRNCWAEARIKIARMTLTIKLDGNWSSFQLANSAPPLSVTDSAIAPSARMLSKLLMQS